MSGFARPEIRTVCPAEDTEIFFSEGGEQSYSTGCYGFLHISSFIELLANDECCDAARKDLNAQAQANYIFNTDSFYINEIIRIRHRTIEISFNKYYFS